MKHMDVISLLKSKNRCLERFLDVSTEFLAAAERGDFDALSAFHEKRESILRVIGLYDRKVTEIVSQIPADQTRDPALVASIREALDNKSSLIQRILTIDERIMACIEAERSRVLKDLASSSRERELVGKFKSAWVPEPGEELDEKL